MSKEKQQQAPVVADAEAAPVAFGSDVETPAVPADVKAFRIKPGVKLYDPSERDDEGRPARVAAGSVVYLTTGQAKAWADLIDPVAE